MNGSVSGIAPRAITSLTARSGVGATTWLGRLWQSMQSIRRRSPFASCSGVVACRDELADAAVAIRHAHVGNRLPFPVGRDELDVVCALCR